MTSTIKNCLRNQPHQPNTPSSIHQIHLLLHLQINPQMNLWNPTYMVLVCVYKRERERERERVHTNSLPRSRAASPNIFLFPELLPQKTQTLLNLPIFLSSLQSPKKNYRKYIFTIQYNQVLYTSLHIDIYINMTILL